MIRYSNRILKNVTELYEKRRTDAQTENTARRRELASIDPKFSEMEQELSSIFTELIGDIAAGKNGRDAAKEAQDKSLSIQEKRTRLLVSLGYPADYLEIQRVCPICEDTGYVGTNQCECFKAALREEAHKTFNLSIHMPDATFDSFDTNLYSPYPYKGRENEPTPRENAELVKKACRIFVRDFETAKDSILLMGASGLGKTHLSSAAAHALIDAGYDIVYETAGVIFSLMEDMRFGRANEETQFRIDRLTECDLLIIDDLGSEFITPFVRSALFSIINGRLLSGKKMIISTNLSQNDIGQLYDSRILSRILGSFICLELYGKDIRRVLRGERP